MTNVFAKRQRSVLFFQVIDDIDAVLKCHQLESDIKVASGKVARKTQNSPENFLLQAEAKVLEIFSHEMMMHHQWKEVQREKLWVSTLYLSADLILLLVLKLFCFLTYGSKQKHH